MLSDNQIDELERLIVFSTMDQLPLILSRAIPVLFSELRLVKATLDSKVNHFLEGIGTDDRTQQGDGAGDYGAWHGTDGQGDLGVPAGSQHLGPEDEVRTPADPLRSEAATGGSREADIGSSEDRPLRGGNRRRKRADQGQVVSGDSESQVGGPLPIETRDPR